MRDPELLRTLHLRWRQCALCGDTMILSLHHLNRHPRDDLESNLVMLCGDGVRGCHGLVTAEDTAAKWQLAIHLREKRPDVLAYLEQRFPREGADAWLRRVLGA